MPRIYSATGLKSQEAGLSDGLSSDIAEQRGTGIVVGTKPAAVNKAIAGTALQVKADVREVDKGNTDDSELFQANTRWYRRNSTNHAPATTIKGKGLTSVSPFVFRAGCAHKTPSFGLSVT